jgi:lipopolysaccharide export system permease protein
VLIFRYLAKEVYVTLASLTAILLLIFMSNQFVRYLNRAASGQLPVVFVMKLMMLEMPNLMVLLLPLGFYMALMLAYGRLYAESEMTVLNACGYGPGLLLRQSLLMASIVALFVLAVMLWFSPYVAVERTQLLRQSGVQTLMQTVVPGQFRAVTRGRQVFYVESMSRDKAVAQNVFLARLNDKGDSTQWDVLWADKAYLQQDSTTHEDSVILEQGQAYQGQPGKADYQVAEFSRYEARLPQPFVETRSDVRTLPTRELWLNHPYALAKIAELQWRISVPLMVFILTFIGVPLSKVDPRSGKFAKLFPAIMIFIVYANCMFIARNWVAQGKISPWIGMWGFHLSFVLLGCILMWRQRVKLS